MDSILSISIHFANVVLPVLHAVLLIAAIYALGVFTKAMKIYIVKNLNK